MELYPTVSAAYNLIPLLIDLMLLQESHSFSSANDMKLPIIFFSEPICSCSQYFPASNFGLYSHSHSISVTMFRSSHSSPVTASF